MILLVFFYLVFVPPALKILYYLKLVGMVLFRKLIRTLFATIIISMHGTENCIKYHSSLSFYNPPGDNLISIHFYICSVTAIPEQ